MKIKTKLVLNGVVALVVVFVISITSLLFEKSMMLEDRKVKTRHLVEVAHGVLAHYHQLQQSGAMDEAAAKDAAMRVIKGMRYEQKEYFWINDFTVPVPRMVMHPTAPALDGQLMDAEKFNCATSMQSGLDGEIEKTDGKKNLFVAFSEVANKAGEGFVTYNWPKPKADGSATNALYAKLSFVKKFDGWNWLIGTGIYIDDVNSAFWTRAAQFGLIGLLAMAILSLFIWQLARSITQPLNQLRTLVLETEQTSDFSRRVAVASDDEVGQTAKAFNQLLNTQQIALSEVSAVVAAMAGGDFDKRVNTDLKGDLKVMQNAINGSADSVQRTMSGLQQVMVALSEGNFAYAADNLEMEGEFKQAVAQAMQAMQAIIGEVNRVMDALAQGDLTQRVQVNAAGDLETLKTHINTSIEQLGVTFSGLGRHIQQVAAASGQAVNAISHVSDGAMNQHHAIGQLAVASEQTRQAISDVSGNALRARERIQQTGAAVRAGQEKMQAMVQVVQTIGDSSEKITSITEVIAGIANKTNLLSLNAAIEAARVGEAGRGFAVVAEEVRKLAESSAQSVESIGQLVAEAVERAHQAKKTTIEVSEDMERIYGYSHENENMIAQIAAAMEQQSATIEEVAANVSSLDKIAETNASASEEIATTMVDLSRIAGEANSGLARFRVA